MPIPTESAPTLALPMLTSTRLFGDGKHGQTECIQTFRCQACYSTFSARRNTPLYRLRTSSHQVAVVLSALAEGFDPSAAERVFGFRQATITTWLSRAGEHAHTLHERFFFHLQLPHRGPAPGRAGTFRRTRLSHPASMAAIGGHKNTINATGNHPSAESRDLFGNEQMRFIGTPKVGTNALGQLLG